MRIIVKTLVGKKIELDVESNDTIMTIKEKIAEKEGVPPDQQRLIFNHTKLDDSLALSNYDIQKDTTLYILFILPIVYE